MSTLLTATPRAGTRIVPQRRVSPALLLVALFLVSLNMRAAMASVPPLLASVQSGTGLDSAGAGLLTTLPVLCMAVFAPLAQRFARRVGREASVAVALSVLCAGLALRSGGAAPLPLFGGTLLAGVGIAVMGVVLPGIVREYFPVRAGAATGLYLTGMALGASTAAGLAVPVERLVGSWEGSLAAWAVPAAVALVAWLPVALRANQRGGDTPHPGRLPWRSGTAWLVSAYLGLQGFGFYSLLAWVSPAYQAAGWSADDAGWLLAAFMLAQLAAGLAVPALADRGVDRRGWFTLVIGCVLVGTVSLLAWPLELPWVFVALLGFGQGGGFALGLLLLVEHGRTPEATGSLSAMAFLVSYLVAAAGPTMLGGLRDATGGFTVPFTVLAALAGVQLCLAQAFSPERRRRGLAESGKGRHARGRHLL